MYSGNTLTSKILFVYDGFKCVEELDALNGNAVALRHSWQPFDVGLDVILATADSTSTSYFLHDANKNVVQKTSMVGMLQEAYIYAPYGKEITENDSYIGFSSEFSIQNVGLSYYNYRFYIFHLGRWNRRDLIEERGGNNLYNFVSNNSIDLYDNNGLKAITPQNGQCPEICCNGRKIQLVPIWFCKRKLGGTGKTRWPLLNHQYICCGGENKNCFGVQKYKPSCMKKCASIKSPAQRKQCEAGCYAKKGDIIEPEVSATGKCEVRCVTPDEKKTSCDGKRPMPEDYHIGPCGIDCQEWADEMTKTKCK